jgi:hypothetical protein
LTSKDGVTGFDLDGNSHPDIALDGTIPPGASTVTDPVTGVKGIDLDGDHRPDIGMQGQLLNYNRLAVGKDGTLGIDLDGDGQPDLALSGQVLPDAKIVGHGVQGLSIDHNNVPSIGLDGKPLPGVHLTTKDGITGLDVNHDHKPDILPDGTFTKFAPIAELPNGVKGIDVDGDGRPDIAVHGGITLPTAATNMAATNVPAGQIVMTPAASSAAPSSSTSLASLGPQQTIGNPQNPSTTLTSLAGSPVVRAQPATAPAAESLQPAVAGDRYGYLPGTFAGATPNEDHGAAPTRHTKLVEHDDVWYEDASGTVSVLGRPME